jgi:outer membrane protein OmpA-like peptidoglycan-associated protein
MYIRPAILSFCSLLFFGNGYAQNLFANPGFEDRNLCAEHGTPCAVEAWFNIPAMLYPVYNQFAKKPVHGNKFLVVPVQNVVTAYKDQKPCIYTMLGCPLLKGERYVLSFYIAAKERIFERLDFYFTDKEPMLDNINELSNTAAFSITELNIDAAYNVEWNHVKYEFTATSNSKFCLIGNFTAMRRTYERKDAMNVSGDILYFIDDISLRPLTDKAACPEYKDNIGKIYAQNYRHTDNTTINKGPQFVKDTITIPGVLFDVSSTVLKPAITKILDSVIKGISQAKFEKIEIIGHTDNTGTAASNETLSLSRAGMVKQYLVKKVPRLSAKLSVTGKGQYSPIASNETEEGRTKNRRVEIILTSINIIE